MARLPERGFPVPTPIGAISGTPLGANCSAVGSDLAAFCGRLRTALRGFLAAARFAGLFSFLALARFFVRFAGAFRVFFATTFLAFRFAFFAIVISLKEFSPVRPYH